jgi:hypothetical protein
MSTSTHWDELNRSQQRLMIRLYGCGTVRNQEPEAIARLYDCGFINDEGELTTLGIQVFISAVRRQQVDAQRRLALAA